MTGEELSCSIASKILSVAVTTQVVLSNRIASPIALWHLLSLDAPTVAALWTWFIARAAHIHLPLVSPAAMALAVWVLYAADRLLDTRRVGGEDELEARHRFHHHHRRGFLTGIAVASVALAALMPQLDAAAIRLYLGEGALLAAWFLVLHATRSAHRLPKEIAVGLFFSGATFIPTVARDPALREELLLPAILFAALCSLNCLFIYAWEHEGFERGSVRRPHATTRLALEHLPELAWGIAMGGALLAIPGPARVRLIPAGCALAAALLLALDRNRRRFSRTDLRAAADLALLTPLLLARFLR